MQNELIMIRLAASLSARPISRARTPKLACKAPNDMSKGHMAKNGSQNSDAVKISRLDHCRLFMVSNLDSTLFDVGSSASSGWAACGFRRSTNSDRGTIITMQVMDRYTNASRQPISVNIPATTHGKTMPPMLVPIAEIPRARPLSSVNHLVTSVCEASVPVSPIAIGINVA